MNIQNELRKLRASHDAGELSDEQFYAQRDELLKRQREEGKEQHGTSFNISFAAAPAPASDLAPELLSLADRKRAEDARIEQIRKDRSINKIDQGSLIQDAPVQRISLTVTETDGTVRLKSEDEIKIEQAALDMLQRARDAEAKRRIAAASIPNNPNSKPIAASLPNSQTVQGGIIKPIEAKKEIDPLQGVIDGIRAKIKDKTITLKQGRELLAKAKEEHAAKASYVACTVCAGLSKDLQDLCMRCKGKQQIRIDVDQACTRMAQGMTVDRRPVSDEEVSYKAFFKDGREIERFADNGDKAIKSATHELMASAQGFNRVVLNSGTILTMREINDDGKPQVTRLFFGDTDKSSGEEKAAKALDAALSEEGYKRVMPMKCTQCQTGCVACNFKGRRFINIVHHVSQETKECPACNGNKKIGEDNCGRCFGYGKILANAKISNELTRSELIDELAPPKAQPIVPIWKKGGPVMTKGAPRHDSAKSKGGIIMCKGWNPNAFNPRRPQKSA